MRSAKSITRGPLSPRDKKIGTTRKSQFERRNSESALSETNQSRAGDDSQSEVDYEALQKANSQQNAPTPEMIERYHQLRQEYEEKRRLKRELEERRAYLLQNLHTGEEESIIDAH